MSATDISFDRRTISECLQQRFALPTYQRDYKWESKHLQELLTDIQEAFLANHEPAHGRKDVASYTPYFLGTIITTPAPDGTKAIVDGQQRITTLAMIVTYFCRLAERKADSGISDIANLLRRRVFGADEFNIKFEAPRAALFSILMQPNANGEDEEERVESIPDLDPGSKRLYELFCQIENFIGSGISGTLTPHFVDYLTQRVYLFEIGVPGEQDGHKVFVTMNDRGLKLGPIDLLKGYLLSNIREDSANQEAHAKWNEAISKLRSRGHDEDSAFFKTWLRAKYALTLRGKNKGDAPRDFELIGESYHRWVMDNKSMLGLNTADDFYNFVTNIVTKYVDHYIKVKDAETSYSADFPHVFYNGARDLTLQTMAILAAINSEDTSADISRKIRGVSYFLDYFATARVLNGKDNTYDNVRDLVFSLVKVVRGKNVATLLDELKQQISTLEEHLVLGHGTGYFDLKRQDLLHLLARIADYLESITEQTNRVRFDVYVDRRRGAKTFDVEHIVPYPPEDERTTHHKKFGYKDFRDFYLDRNRLGGLILLPRGRNRSLQDLPFDQKLERYATENILAQSFCEHFYKNNPSVAKVIAEQELPLKPVKLFTKTVIEGRSSLYQSVIEKLWSIEGIAKAMV